jgi:hypothetical protein
MRAAKDERGTEVSGFALEEFMSVEVVPTAGAPDVLPNPLPNPEPELPNPDPAPEPSPVPPVTSFREETIAETSLSAMG